MFSKGILFLLFALTASDICESAIPAPAERQAEIGTNEDPIIGILSLDQSFSLDKDFPGYHAYLSAGYIKFVESGGARAVPIWIDRDRDYYADIMSKLNGVLFPGGGLWFNDSGYATAGQHIYDIAIEMNNNGDYMPIWGTCLGFELLTFVSLNGTEHRADCSSNNQPLPLVFKPDYRESRLFKDAPNEIVRILAEEPVTSNYHKFCVTEKNLTAFNLDKQWRVMSVNDDWDGLTFISSIEHKTYPFYGIQFHPEKNMFEWIKNRNLSHTTNAIRAAQYFANFFVAETQKSNHKFDSVIDENNHMIYNYPTFFTGVTKSIYEQCYFFKKDVDYVNGTYNSNSAADERDGSGDSTASPLKYLSKRSVVYSMLLASISMLMGCWY